MNRKGKRVKTIDVMDNGMGGYVAFMDYRVHNSKLEYAADYTYAEK